MFFFLMMSLYFWWISQSSSISLLMVLIFSVFSVMGYSFLLDSKIFLFMIILTLSGGLFVLISFIVMFFPGDYKVGMIYSKGMMKFFLVFFFLSFFLSFKVGSMFSNFMILGSEVSVWGNFVMVYIFLIVLLFFFLFLLNSVVSLSTGSMFSKKKFGGGE